MPAPESQVPVLGELIYYSFKNTYSLLCPRGLEKHKIRDPRTFSIPVFSLCLVMVNTVQCLMEAGRKDWARVFTQMQLLGSGQVAHILQLASQKASRAGWDLSTSSTPIPSPRTLKRVFLILLYFWTVYAISQVGKSNFVIQETEFKLREPRVV